MMRHPIAELIGSLTAPAGHPLTGPAAGPAPPKSVSVVHYGPDGASVATTGKASYAAQKGGGLAVSYASAHAGGVPAASSSVQVDSQGKAQGATTQILGLDGKPTRVVTGDYGGLSLTVAGTVQSGAAKLTVASPQGQQTHAATMTYAAETFAAYALTTLDAKEAVQSQTAISYAKAQMAGTRLIGGSLAVILSDPAGKLRSQAQSNLSRQGVPQTVQGTNFAPDGKTPKLLLVSNYAGVAFSPLRLVQSGQLLVTSQTPEGQTKAQTVFCYKAGKLVTRAPLQPGELILPVIPEAQATVPGPWTPPRPPDQSAQMTRSDGSLIGLRQDWFVTAGATGTPLRSVVTLYATDGTTVIRITDIDYAGAKLDAAGVPVAGTVVSTQFQAGVRASITHVSY